MAGIMPTAMGNDPVVSSPEEEATETVQNPAEESQEVQPGGDTVPDDEGSNVSPEEQEAYEAFVLKGFDLLYAGGKVRPKILKLLDEDPSDLKKALGEHLELDAPADEQSPDAGSLWDTIKPVIVLAAAGAIVTLEVVRSYGQEQPDGAVIMHGGKQFLEDLAEIAGNSGIHDYSEEEMADAFRRGADIFRDAAEAEGLVDMEQAKQEWGQIVQADKEGRIDDVVPGISQLGGQQEGQAPAPEQGME